MGQSGLNLWFISAFREGADREWSAQTEVCQDGAHYNRSFGYLLFFLLLNVAGQCSWVSTNLPRLWFPGGLSSDLESAARIPGSRYVLLAESNSGEQSTDINWVSMTLKPFNMGGVVGSVEFTLPDYLVNDNGNPLFSRSIVGMDVDSVAVREEGNGVELFIGTDDENFGGVLRQIPPLDIP